MSESTEAAKAAPNAAIPDKVMRKMTRRRLRVPAALRTPLAIIGVIVLALWVLVVIFAPLLEPRSVRPAGHATVRAERRILVRH